MMEGKPPQERFPAIGTVDDAAVFRDCQNNLLLCYEIAPVDGRGNVVLAFSDVVYFEQNPNNVPEGLRNSRYPVNAWDFTEIFGSDQTDRLSRQCQSHRFWTISFNDTMVLIVFADVKQVHVTRESISADAALLAYLRTRR
jgi:hypothetical protein